MTLNLQEKVAFLLIHYPLYPYPVVHEMPRACKVTKHLFTCFLVALILFRELNNFKLVDYEAL